MNEKLTKMSWKKIKNFLLRWNNQYKPKISKQLIRKTLNEYNGTYENLPNIFGVHFIVQILMFFINLLFISVVSLRYLLIPVWFIIVIIYFFILINKWKKNQILEDNFQDDSKKLDFINDFLTYLDEDKTKDSKLTIKEPVKKLKFSTESLIRHPNRINNLESLSLLHFSLIIITSVWVISSFNDLESPLILIICLSYCIIFTGIPISFALFSLRINLFNIDRCIDFLKEEYYEHQSLIDKSIRDVLEKRNIKKEDLDNILIILQEWANSYWGYPYNKEEINILAQEFHTFIYDVNELEEWALLFEKLRNKIEIEKIIKKTKFEDEQILNILSRLSNQLRFEINQKRDKINIDYRRNELIISAVALLISFGSICILIFKN